MSATCALADAWRTLIAMLWALLSEPVWLMVGAVAAHPVLAVCGMLGAISAGALAGRWVTADREA